MPRRRVLERIWCELFGRMHEMRSRDVFGADRGDICERMQLYRPEFTDMAQV